MGWGICERMHNERVEQRICSFDFFKALASIGVVLIHCHFPGPVGGIFRTCAKFSVPYFFMISGYFAIKTQNNSWKYDRGIIKKKINHVITMIFGAGLFYACFQLIFMHMTVDSLKEIFAASDILKFFAANSPFIYSHLWFILALLYCYLFIYLFADILSLRFAVAYVPIFALLFLFLSEILPSFGVKINILSSFVIYNVFFFRALPFFLLGSLLKWGVHYIQRVNLQRKHCIAAVLVGCFISLIEKVLLTESQFYFGSYIMCVAIFIFCMKYNESISQSVEFMGRELTMYIYVIHIAVMKLLDLFCKFDGFYGVVYSWIRPIVVIIVSAALSYTYWYGNKIYKKTHRG